MFMDENDVLQLAFKTLIVMKKYFLKFLIYYNMLSALQDLNLLVANILKVQNF